MNKKFTVTVKRHCKSCNKDHNVLCSSLTYKVPDALSAAKKAHQYLVSGGPYHDFGFLGSDVDIYFAIKEAGMPRGEGITFVEQRAVM